MTIDVAKIKTINGKEFLILPIWEQEKRNNRFLIKPLLKEGENYIYSPIMTDEIRKRWTNGLLQFYSPYEIRLPNVVKELAEWKNYYEHLFSTDIEHLFKYLEFDYYKYDVDIRREDRKGNHSSINELGDYDVIGSCKSLKTVFIIECKVLQPIGSIFEHSNEQKRFFKEEKFDEKFQKRINYFTNVYRSFFTNIGYDIGPYVHQIRPYMVVNKVFESYYKTVIFPIVTYNELKSEITSLKEWCNPIE